MTKRVETFLKKTKEGITIDEIAKSAKISRNSVILELARLDGAEKIRFRKIGNVKLYFWTGGNRK